MKRSVENEISEEIELLQISDYGYLTAVTCRFRSQNNLKCAIGCLIADEDYFPDMENCLFAIDYDNENIIQNYLIKKNINPNFFGLLRKLQIIHDRHRPIEWFEKLKNLAKDEELEFEIKKDPNI